MVTETHLKKGRRLLKRGEWKEAKSIFEQALAVPESAGEAFEGLGTACSWLNDAEATIRAREQAFHFYQQAADNQSAARVAAWLAIDYAEFRGEHAVANGWLQNALRLAAELGPCYERGFVLGVAAAVKMFAEKDLKGARKLAREASEIARTIGNADGLLMAGALEGLALVSEGKVHEGMRLLDESTATAFGGVCEDLYIIGSSCCCLITACEKVRDFDRAGQWCNQVKEFCRRWRIGSLFAVCRTQYSSVLLSRGEWPEAEEEITLATEELSERRPALVSAATVRMAELRRRQGRVEEARSLFQSAEGHPLALLGMGALALGEQEWETAAEFAERFLRRAPVGATMDQVPGFELLIKACTRTGNLERAKKAFESLRSVAEIVSTEPLTAAKSFAGGLIATSEGHLQEALACFEDALDLFEEARMPFESIEARIEVARTLKQLGRDARARMEAESAFRHAESMGAGSLMGEVQHLLPGSQPRQQSSPQAHVLSPREREILMHITEGKDNIRIADELFLSVRTVERHISNIYLKLGISGKSARTAAVMFALKNLKGGEQQ